jgi:hypothetical protein
MLVVLSWIGRINPRFTISSGTQRHGQHLQIHSLVSYPDDTDPTFRVRTQRFGPLSRWMTIGSLPAALGTF